jgi:hypothetical protein
MGKTFRAYQPDQLLVLPPSLQEWLPADHLAYFVSEVVDALDLSGIYKSYSEERWLPAVPSVHDDEAVVVRVRVRGEERPEAPASDAGGRGVLGVVRG